MRTALFAIALLQAAAAIAQPTVGAEVASGPLTWGASFALAAPSIAMARDRSGVVIAWMMAGADGAGKIHVARLDATAHFTGTIRDIPVLSSETFAVDATYPSIAASPGGNGFTLAWLEAPYYSYPSSYSTTWRAVYCQLDLDLNPTRPSILVEAISSPVIVRSGKTTWLTAGSRLWQMQPDGSLSVPITPGLAASDMTATTDLPQIVTSYKVQTGFICACGSTGRFNWFCQDSCKIFQYKYKLQLVSLYTASGGPSFSFENQTSPAVQSDGRDVLVAWYQGAAANGGGVVAARVRPTLSMNLSQELEKMQFLGTFGPEAGQVRPDIATDGQRYVVVWRSTSATGDHDIIGASIALDGTVTPLSIATSSADERDPSVISLGNGSFLVAYEKLSSGERRIAGRIVTFEGRQRAAR
jgi:hypothetical protein